MVVVVRYEHCKNCGCCIDTSIVRMVVVVWI